MNQWSIEGVLMITRKWIDKYYSDGDPDHELYLLFTKARYLTFRAREKELQRYELSPEQAQVLLVVHEMEGRVTPAELSRLLLRQPHSVSALINRMQEKGLVKKVKDLERRNMVRVTLTKKGEEAYWLTCKRGPIHRIMGSLNESERESFQECLDKIMEKAKAELGMDRDNLPSSEVF